MKSIMWNRRKLLGVSNSETKAKNKLDDIFKNILMGDKDDDEDEKRKIIMNNDVYSVDNHIYFVADVNRKNINMLIGLICEKNDEYKDILDNPMIKDCSPNPLYLHITSYGGDLNECFRAVDTIKNSKIPIYTIIEGYAASAGTVLAIVGKKRFMTKSSYILIHQLSSGCWGKFSEMEDEYYNNKMIMEDIVEIYRENSKMSKAKIEKQLKHDTWWRIDTCLKNGFVDEVFEGEID